MFSNEVEIHKTYDIVPFVVPNLSVRNHVEHRRCDTFRVSDTLCIQHAYEIKDFGSTIPSSKNL